MMAAGIHDGDGGRANRLFLFLLLFVTSLAQAAAPVLPDPSTIPTRTSCTAPCGVHFDATGTKDADLSGTQAFSRLEYRWDFGDANAGTWSNGANTTLSKNLATGAVAAHVYETPGTYTWKLEVNDGSSAVQTTSGRITVADPADTFAGTATVCIANSTATAGGGGCPSGASTPAGTTDFSAALSSCLGPNRRCLFKRGDTFTAGAITNISAGGAITVGAYGPATDPLPVINARNIIGVLTFSSSAVNDARIMDLEIVGSGATDTGLGINFSAKVNNVTVLRVTIRNIGRGTSVVLGRSIRNTITGTILQDNKIYDYYARGGNGFFGTAIRSAFLGNSIGPVPKAPAYEGEHGIRIQGGQKTVVSHNTITSPNSGKTHLTIRALPHATADDDTWYVYVSDNKLVGDLNPGIIVLAPSSNTQNEHIYDVILERNWIVYGAAPIQIGVNIQASRVIVRNNLFDFRNAGSAFGVRVINANNAGIPAPDLNEFHNNTFFSAARAQQFVPVMIEGRSATGVTNTIVRNNLAYGPNYSTTALPLTLGTVAGTVSSNNSTDSSGSNQIKLADPSFASATPTDPADFRIGAGSYAANGGTAHSPAAKSDFFNCSDRNGNVRIGAFVPRSSAQCRPAAGSR